jgi:acyl-coenzyme A synthetase/AMP-(fatty) acid ligase
MTLATLNDFFTDASGGERALLLHKGRAYTRGAVARLIRKTAVVAAGMPGRECVLHVQDNFRFVIGFFALLHSGKDVILASNVRENTLEAIGTRNVLSDAGLDALEDPCGDGDDDVADIRPFQPKGANVVFFTSGSTGEPKRITKTFHSLYLELASIDALLSPLGRGGTMTLSTVTMSHHYGLTFLLLYSMASGFLIDATPIESPEDLACRLNQHKNALLVTSPAFMDRLGRHRDSYAFPSKPYLTLCAGAPLSREGAEALRDMLGASPLEIFGSTETGIVAFRRQLESEAWTLAPYTKAHAAPDGRLVVTSDFAAEAECVLGDSVGFLDGEHFVLRGRVDRMVKIEDKRVSLPEIEAALSSHGFIRQAYCLPVTNKNGREVVGACVCLSQEGREFAFESGRKKMAELLKGHMVQRIDRVAIPQKWRFVDEIPVNALSKVIHAEIAAIMLSSVAEPVVLKKTILGDTAEMEIAFLAESAYFEGHFPGCAILPGVVQVHFAAHFSDKIWKTGVAFKEIKKLRFSKIVKPSQKLKLALAHSGQQVYFKYCNAGGTVCSQGTIVYA